MLSKAVILLSVLSSVFIVLAQTERSWLRLSGMTPAQRIIESIPKKDRGLFVSFHLSTALSDHRVKPRFHIELPYGASIPEDKYKKFKGIPTYGNFSLDLLHWTKRLLNASNSQLRDLVTNFCQICFPNGECFDPNDIGELCCPF